MSLPNPPLVSVVVCTRNRSSFLLEVGEKIAAVRLPAGGWELVIVDNASTDDTPQVIAALRASHPELVRVIREPQIGLSAARNRGVKESRGEFIVFIDDDAFPYADWLNALVAALTEPGVYCAGGPVEPMFQGSRELPDWFLGRFLPSLTVWDLGPNAQPLTYNEYPRGANIAYRKEAFARFGLFSTHLGRRGSRLLSCEEIEHCLRIERGGGKIMYAPRARVRHLTVAARITVDWMGKRYRAQGQSEAIVNWMHAGLTGVRTGLRAFRRNLATAKQLRGTDGEVFAHCQRQAYLGYLLAIPRTVLTVPRVEALHVSAPMADWRPPG